MLYNLNVWASTAWWKYIKTDKPLLSGSGKCKMFKLDTIFIVFYLFHCDIFKLD